MHSCASFIIQHESTINKWLVHYIEQENQRFQTETILFASNKGKKKKEPKPVELPPIQAVPKEWKVFVEPLAVITSFTDQIEGDLNLQQNID